ncbi:MAG: archaellin/type IV pilin N-terminal domain-containing protein [Chloroflexota bacterium]
MHKVLSWLHRDEKGVTGLETAIILIAFVVVASVFAYTILSAGIFATARGQEAVYSGLQQARSSFEPRGDVMAYKGTVSGTAAIGKVVFTIAAALPGQKIDLTPPYSLSVAGAPTASGLSYITTAAYQDSKQYINDAAWTVSFLGNNNGDYMLEGEEKAEVSVWLLNYDGSAYSLGAGATDPFIDSAGNLLTTYTDFNIELKPPKGAALTIAKTTPSRLDTVTNLR